ncbi:hypothetical protein P171DRAFT_483911 [Karstenula rhodostoma CBS 690.94]|uniref:Uncharacterized protein n=1 Tax=Karstenula rhodostoma CBS 690.94 TaxID=1392251 RepID=A0A9P4PMB2_9PLEO|nr:hypothetical protein P171DRAFT_483911 [Karstenula rhodostoma CBS 690.94]
MKSPRIPASKISGLYSQENIQLPAIAIQRGCEDSSLFDGDISTRNSTITTVESTPSSSPSSTTFSTQDTVVVPDTPESRKRQRLPEPHIFDLHRYENGITEEMHSNVGYKKFRSSELQHESLLSGFTHDHSRVEHVLDLHQPHPYSKKPPNQSTRLVSVSLDRHGNQASTLMELGGERDGISKRGPLPTRLPVHLVGLKSQHKLRRQNGFYNLRRKYSSNMTRETTLSGFGRYLRDRANDNNNHPIILSWSCSDGIKVFSRAMNAQDDIEHSLAIDE